MIKCPYCGEEIRPDAKKCKHCGEWLDESARPNQSVCNEPVIIERPASQPQSDFKQNIVIQNEVKKSNGLGTAGFIFSLLGLIFSWVPVGGWIIWVFGFLFSFIGLFKSPRGMAITGFILSLIDLIILIVVIGAVASIFV